MKISKISVLLIIIAIIFVGVIAAASTGFDAFSFGQNANNILSEADGTVIATVDGAAIYESDLQLVALTAKSLSPQNAIDDQQILNDLIRKQVVYNQAEKLGLVVPYEQAKKSIITNYNLIKSLAESQDGGERADAQTALGVIEEYMRGFGLTEEQYIEMASKQMQKIMTYGACYNHFKEGLAKDIQADAFAVNEQYEKYIDDLLAKADIQYVNK
ncbi:MAG: SurA N-terminal domain-containing protein [Clostridia bacterium]|nr:SurA N-terminal domain-containing protein [Clostridia bacterium]MDD4799219.1 SurA N-terminal domain-containing protein [Clostridia bacterium]